MKLYFKEEQLGGNTTNLTILLGELNPLTMNFRVKLNKNRSHDYFLTVRRFPTTEVPSAYRVIYNEVSKTDEVEKIKTAFKLGIKSELEKNGVLKGLSEEKIK